MIPPNHAWDVLFPNAVSITIQINDNLFAEVPRKLCPRFINDDENPLIKHLALHGSTIIRFADWDSYQNDDKNISFRITLYFD